MKNSGCKIPKNIIEGRFSRSLENLADLKKIFDELYVSDFSLGQQDLMESSNEKSKQS